MKMLSTMAVGLIYMHTRAAADDAAVDGAVKAADDLFARGSVGAAQQKYEELLRSRPGSAEITERLGYIYHLTGQYQKAVAHFEQAAKLSPRRRIPILAYSVYTRYLLRDYAAALETLKEVQSAGYQYQTAFFSAEQLQQLVRTPPDQMPAKLDRTTVPFEAFDPLPVIRVKINSRTVHAIIDTGGPQFVVDPVFAAEEHIKPLSWQTARGIGGRAGQKVGFTVAGGVTLGDIELRNVPMMLLPVRTLSELFGVQIDAVLGTETLAQFLPTLDFPGRKLILRTKTRSNREEIRGMKAKATLPFILDDMHSMYAQCRFNDRDAVLLYFDTGLVDDRGASILTSRDRLVELGVPLSSGSRTGYADIGRVSVGSLERTDVKALYGSGEQLVCCEYIKPYGLIGHNYLKHYSWTIDFDNRMFLFDY